MVTVHDLLQGNTDYEFSVLAGHRGLDKEVKAISFIDSPSSVEWLRGNEVILTTAFLYQTDEVLFQQFVRDLIKKNVSALGIKLGRYIKSIPESILESADINMFPIFILPFEMVWSEFFERFYYRENGDEDVGRYLKINLPSLMLSMDINAESRSKLRQVFLDSLNVSAAITDNDYNILTMNDEPGISEVKHFCESRQKQSWHNPFRMQTTSVGNIWFLDVVLSDTEHLIISSNDSSISSKIVDRLRILYHSSKKKRLMQGSKDVLLQSLLEGIVFASSQSDLWEIAQLLNIEYNNKFWIVIAAGEHADEGCAMCRKVVEKVVGSKNCAFYNMYVGFEKNRHMVAFFSLRTPQITKTELRHKIWQAFNEEEIERNRYRLFFSEVCNRFDDIKKSYSQAQTTYQYYQTLGTPNMIIHDYWDVQPFDYLLHSDIDLHEIDMLAQKITTFDAVQALEHFLEYNSIRLAAEANYVHENTMRYRINKAKAVVGRDFNNPNTRLTFLIKIKLWRFNEKQK